MLVNGKPTKPFTIETYPPMAGKPEYLESMKQLSYATYGRPRAEVEAEIMAKYQNRQVTQAPAQVVASAAAPTPASASAPAQNSPFQL